MPKKIQYLGDSVGSVLPVRMHRSQHPFIAEIERILDSNLGPYNETQPEDGGSWSRSLNGIYPLTGDWGVGQDPATASD